MRLSNQTIEAALNCIAACRDDPREPQRYRQWYSEAWDEIKAFQEAEEASVPAALYESLRTLVYQMFFDEDQRVRGAARLRLQDWIGREMGKDDPS